MNIIKIKADHNSFKCEIKGNLKRDSEKSII